MTRWRAGEMATLLAVYNSEGCVGRCDARCYDAASPTCACICGGANHGAGYVQAVENTVAMMERELEANGLIEQLERFKELHGLNGDNYTVKVRDMQLVLPGMEDDG
jgi:hypothetical protein